MLLRSVCNREKKKTSFTIEKKKQQRNNSTINMTHFPYAITIHYLRVLNRPSTGGGAFNDSIKKKKKKKKRKKMNCVV